MLIPYPVCDEQDAKMNVRVDQIHDMFSVCEKLHHIYELIERETEYHFIRICITYSVIS